MAVCLKGPYETLVPGPKDASAVIRSLSPPLHSSLS